MFLHDPMTVDVEKLTTRELKELIGILRERTPRINDPEQVENLADDIVAPVFHILMEPELNKYKSAIVYRLSREFGMGDVQ